MKKRAVVYTCLSALNLAVVLGVWPTAARAQYENCDPFVLIDPGHGGTIADTLPICDPPYNYGAPCWENLCHEREVNLAVALRLGVILQTKACQEGVDYYFTRKNDSKICNIDRARMAEQLGVQQFISIHHNGDTATNTNYTWTKYCDWDTTATPRKVREDTAALALKIWHKIRDTFNIAYKDPKVECGLTVLRNTSMASVLTEASFISNPSEARRFVDGDGIRDEAEAIYEGLCSYLSNAGVAIVQQSYSCFFYPNSGAVKVDNRWQASPFMTTWGEAGCP
ncbi:MAG: N-acetylmuramoyl-L-alanine amidase [candidate division Zixibacteria bacterium]|nr:N-acetylmuramoyl-L-alanine amidase [candidate division Zixibacteria bacterium]